MKLVQALNDKIEEANVIILLTGAGFSADSGLPTYGSLGTEYYEISSFDCLKNNPKRFWSIWEPFIKRCKSTSPHKGYEIFQKLLSYKSNSTDNFDYFIFTSNVDGHFPRYFKRNVRECHGSVVRYQCLELCEEKCYRSTAKDPFKCKLCGEVGFLRPNVCLYNDRDWLENSDQKKKYMKWKTNLLRRQDAKILLLEIGAGRTLRTVRYEAETLLKKLIQRNLQAVLFRVNITKEDLVVDCQQNNNSEHIYFIDEAALTLMEKIGSHFL